MSDFIDYLRSLNLSQDSEPSDAEKRQAKTAILEAVHALHQNTTPNNIKYALLGRIFDKIPSCLDANRTQELTAHYLTLTQIMNQKTGSTEQLIIFQLAAEKFIAELLKECRKTLFDNENNLRVELITMLKLDDIEMNEDQMISALIHAYIHHLRVDIEIQFRTQLLAEADAGKISQDELETILAKHSVYIEEKISSLINANPLTTQKMDAFINPTDRNIYSFIQSYIQHGHTPVANSLFLATNPHAEAIKNIAASQTSLFQNDNDTLGNSILRYIAQMHPIEASLVAHPLLAKYGNNTNEKLQERAKDALKIMPVNKRNLELPSLLSTAPATKNASTAQTTKMKK